MAANAPSPLPAYEVGERAVRPWGEYEVTAVGDLPSGQEYCEKTIIVVPGGMSSLQSHDLRMERWLVREGELIAMLGDKEIVMQEGDALDIPLGQIHSMANRGTIPCIVFERQEGICREDDIRRYLDAYGRATVPLMTDDIEASIQLYKKIQSQLR